MTKEEIISGLKFTIEMFLFDPSTGETYQEPRNDMDKTTIDACKGAIELLKKEPCNDTISRQAVLKAIEDNAKDIRYGCFASNTDAECFKQTINELPLVTS